ncbi:MULTISPECIES: TOBE domain-containing protein [Tatumella]|uniref:TOBE domain-containing protein n=1 Tax=Tatumella punctata TaxID=399969 RepID=A0ABW1VM96_9GAMM|nr:MULTISPECIES: TOBE domain-containing protein [unclassified Tatumella]MBS0854642.1 TOBE domain-containing protein [Tatumella sp. JGM16]MBS0875911.1 TOBE domain-containing protein [Tatumella sp. JGM82]MBS0890316.1 TOBE domain-containing protein [Tatumella sp. JGM94]MBS0892577.1 TOBE domain-containing protein [Tatumella sp. JGM130]MBS0900442.1 TOBE domain-containing protein [Tatumella sp. JGM100]
MQADISLTLHLSNTLFADPRRITLLDAVRQTGSISHGAKLTGISYKTAWDAINEMNALADVPVVISNAGGKGGGGARLTAHGLRLLQLYQLLEQIQQKIFNNLQKETLPLNSLLAAIARSSLQTSARNQLFGTVSAIRHAGPIDIVSVLLSDRQTCIEVSVTRDSSHRLQLVIDKEVLVLIKASWLQIHTGPVTEGNRFSATVSNITSGTEGDEVLMQLDNGEALCATLPSSAHDFYTGQQVQVSFRPENALLACLS